MADFLKELADNLSLDERNGGAAFPTSILHKGDTLVIKGMTLRDWFAGQALSGVAAGYWGNQGMLGLSPRDLANEAFQIADAMIEERQT